MAVTGRITEVVREVEMLRGIAAGVALDYQLTDGELRALSEWVACHEYLMDRYPFCDLQQSLARVSAGEAEGDPREELLDWCCQFGSPDSVGVLTTTDAVRRLHGVLAGIAADGVVTEQEVHDLRDWLLDYEAFLNVWPFDFVSKVVGGVLADGHVDADEQAELLAMCKDLGGVVQAGAVAGEPVTPHAASRSPVYSTLQGICDPGPVVVGGKVFCFTGKASCTREALCRAVHEAGGETTDRVDHRTDYLVIGDLSNPAWAFASYGRKVERAVALRREGSGIRVVREATFMEAVGHLAQSRPLRSLTRLGRRVAPGGSRPGNRPGGHPEPRRGVTSTTSPGTKPGFSSLG